jgi:hypothetical protein
MTIVSKSIHPRNHYLVDKTCKRGEKVNTAKSRNPAKKGTLSKRERVFNARTTAMSSTIKNSKTPQAWRMPGSLRGW